MHEDEYQPTGCGALFIMAAIVILFYMLPSCSTMQKLAGCPCPIPQQTIMDPLEVPKIDAGTADFVRPRPWWKAIADFFTGNVQADASLFPEGP